MDKTNSAYVVVFATAVCVVMATGLAGTFNALKTTIDANNLFDKQRNVLIACGLYKMEEGKSQPELEKLFADKVVVKVIEFTESMVPQQTRVRGEVKTEEVKQITAAKETDIKIEDLAKARRADDERILGEVYIATVGDAKSYCIPISGYGLWSTLYGFLALAEDRNTVVGITFYKHGETPGLGGEVDNVSWQQGWRGKTILDDRGEVVSITVKKGTVDPNIEREKKHMVDGLSGATITCNGVTRFVKKDLDTYEPYFAKQPGRQK